MAKTKAWFKPLRNSYIAINYKGALAYIPFTLYLLLALILPLKYLSSKALALMITIVLWFLGTYVMTAFAKSKARKVR